MLDLNTVEEKAVQLYLHYNSMLRKKKKKLEGGMYTDRLKAGKSGRHNYVWFFLSAFSNCYNQYSVIVIRQFLRVIKRQLCPCLHSTQSKYLCPTHLVELAQ